MAIVLSDQYPGKTAGPTTNYPQGEPRNVTTPGDGTGTPWEAAIVKDIVGFQQALLKAANITPSGQPDNANVSQYLAAINKLISNAKPLGRSLGMVRFNGSGQILASSGGISVSRLGQGFFEVTLDTPAPDTNYMPFLSGAYGFNGASSINLANNFPQTTTKFRIICTYGGDNTQGTFDPLFINVDIRSIA